MPLLAALLPPSGQQAGRRQAEGGSSGARGAHWRVLTLLRCIPARAAQVHWHAGEAQPQAGRPGAALLPQDAAQGQLHPRRPGELPALVSLYVRLYQTDSEVAGAGRAAQGQLRPRWPGECGFGCRAASSTPGLPPPAAWPPRMRPRSIRLWPVCTAHWLCIFLNPPLRLQHPGNILVRPLAVHISHPPPPPPPPPSPPLQHPGNILVRLEEPVPGGLASRLLGSWAQHFKLPRLVLLDVGMIARLSTEDQHNLVGFFKVRPSCMCANSIQPSSCHIVRSTALQQRACRGGGTQGSAPATRRARC